MFFVGMIESLKPVIEYNIVFLGGVFIAIVILVTAMLKATIN